MLRGVAQAMMIAGAAGLVSVMSAAWSLRASADVGPQVVVPALSELQPGNIVGIAPPAFAPGLVRTGDRPARVGGLQPGYTREWAQVPLHFKFGGGDEWNTWAGLTRSIGGQYLPEAFLDTFVRQIALESGNFDPDVIAGRRVSTAGAEGIAQLMPSSYPNVNRRDPVASLHAASATMRDNLRLYGGDVRKALSAYNAGGGTVARLTEAYGSLWEIGLPDETKLYLRIILGGQH